jgi:DegV family protein with EDD domain
MKKVAVVVDGMCCLPRELVEKHDIRVVPLYIIHKGKSYRDGVDITPGEVYKIMRKRQELPTTSTPSVGDFLEAYTDLSKKAESVFCTTLSSLQSKTYEAALVARDRAKEVIPGTPIEVLDTRSAAGVVGFIALEAARAAERGADLPEVINVAQRVMAKARLVAMLDTLFYLARTGRTGRAAAWAATALNMKPVVEHYAAVGETMPVARPRTTAKAVEVMLKLMANKVGSATVHVNVHHADELEEGEKLKARIASRFNCKELYLTEFTPGMGVHAGPGVLGISFYAD